MEGNECSTYWENLGGGSVGRAKCLWKGRAYEEKGVGSVSGSCHSHEKNKEGERKIMEGESCARKVGDKIWVHP